ncbi:MAG TPA: ACP S-malonyltransferase [Acidimicrobiia bacterium]|nr:ACP S-malonyltransferase [Acidimicrobiia bacterium]
MTFAVLFPGQGSQAVGMGADVFDARPDLLGEAADEVLGWSLRSICLQGPEEELTRTDRAQPALYAVAYAIWDELRARLTAQPSGAAGHSLGEYTALAASGALSYLDGLRLVAARGAAMADAAAREPSTMAALIGADLPSAEALVAERRADGGRLWVANINAPGQIVVAGGVEDVEWAAGVGRERGIRRVVPLKVAGAFHSPYMASAAEALSAAVADTVFGEPGFAVYANATGTAYDGQVGPTLVDQLTSPVRFAESLAAMAASGVTTFVHVGPGDVTAGLARRSVEGAEIYVVSGIDDIDAVAGALAAD